MSSEVASNSNPEGELKLDSEVDDGDDLHEECSNILSLSEFVAKRNGFLSTNGPLRAISSSLVMKNTKRHLVLSIASATRFKDADLGRRGALRVGVVHLSDKQYGSVTTVLIETYNHHFMEQITAHVKAELHNNLGANRTETVITNFALPQSCLFDGNRKVKILPTPVRNISPDDSDFEDPNSSGRHDVETSQFDFVPDDSRTRKQSDPGQASLLSQLLLFYEEKGYEPICWLCKLEVKRVLKCAHLVPKRNLKPDAKSALSNVVMMCESCERMLDNFIWRPVLHDGKILVQVIDGYRSPNGVIGAMGQRHGQELPFLHLQEKYLEEYRNFTTTSFPAFKLN